MNETKNFKFNIGETVTANIYGKIGTGEILERVQDDITKFNQYYVEFVFSNNCVNRMWIYEDNLIKIGFKLKEQCHKFNVDYDTALVLKINYPELTDEQVIMYYRPDCYINWLGELVDPSKK